jgi:type I restriction-modification system DNA methylase subunit
MVEIIEPHGGKVFDPACGSGGMFVQSAQFIERNTARTPPPIWTSTSAAPRRRWKPSSWPR